MPKPPGVANSVFDIARPPPKATAAASTRSPHAPLIELGAIKIRSGVPLPASIRVGASERTVRYKALLAKMKVGDSVELMPQQAKAIVACAKRIGVKVAIRRISPTVFGLWRVAK